MLEIGKGVAGFGVFLGVPFGIREDVVADVAFVDLIIATGHPLVPLHAGLAMGEKEVGQFLDGDPGGLGPESASAKLALRLDAEVVGLALGVELLPLALALRVVEIDEPSGAEFARRGFPFSFVDDTTESSPGGNPTRSREGRQRGSSGTQTGSTRRACPRRRHGPRGTSQN